jgi:hypothetical protein
MTKLGVLQVLLTVIGVLSGLAGLFLLFATNLLFSLMAVPVEPVFFIFMTKVFGAVTIAIAYASLVASRDPARYVAVVDMLIIIMVLAAALGVYAEIGLHLAIGHVTASLVWTGTAVRLILAIAFLILRPRTKLV